MPQHGYGIGRRRLLEILAARALALGVRVRFEREVEDLSELADADLVVVCDGVSSRLRRQHRDQFGTAVGVGRNKYIWLGTRKVFDAFTFAFVETEAGWIWCHAYGFDRNTSTFIVECSPETWAGLGFDRLGEADTLVLLERLFASWLDGHRLRATSHANDGAQWLNFRTLTNERWHHEKLVLLGDAAHTTHFTIGSGTKLASRTRSGSLPSCTKAVTSRPRSTGMRHERQRALVPAQSDARFSAQWFENVPRYAGLEPERFFALLQGAALAATAPDSAACVLPASSRRQHVATLRRLQRWVAPRIRGSPSGRRRAAAAHAVVELSRGLRALDRAAEADPADEGRNGGATSQRPWQADALVDRAPTGR